MRRRIGAALLCGAMLLTACDPPLPGTPPGGRGEAPIVGGAVDPGHAAVALVLFDAGGERYLCTGTRIAPHAFLTAAHCAVRDDRCNSPWSTVACRPGPAAAFTVYGGTQPVDQDTWEPVAPAWEATVISVHPHPLYGTGWDGAPSHDVAVLTIAPPVVHAGQEPEPIPWLSAPDEAAFASGRTFLAVGYGVTRASTGAGAGTKRVVELAIDGHDAATFWYDGTEGNTCGGDSGGPALARVDGRETVIGTTSYGDAGCREYGVNMRTDAERAFIAAHLGAPSGTGCPAARFDAAGLPLPVPDDDPAGIRSQLAVGMAGTISRASLSIEIRHPYVGDLVVTLRAPDGTAIPVWHREGGAGDDLNLEGWPLASLEGHLAAGSWTLEVADREAEDLGTLEAWSLELVAGCAGG